jgi:hypothetical protein
VLRNPSLGIQQAGILALFVGLAAATLGSIASPLGGAGSLQLPSSHLEGALGTQFESALCASIEPNATLRAEYAQVYDGLANATQAGSGGGNGSQLKNQSAYPNVTVGTAQLISAWSQICDSPSYAALYQRWGLANVTEGGQLLASGYYQESYGFHYWASCENSTIANSSGCQWDSDWNVNLATGNVTGPYTTRDDSLPGGYPGGPSGPSSPGNSTAKEPTAAGPSYSATYQLLALGAISIALVALAAVVVRRGRAPPIPVPERSYDQADSTEEDAPSGSSTQESSEKSTSDLPQSSDADSVSDIY